MDEIILKIKEFTEKNDFYSALSLLCAEEKNNAIILYAGTYSFDMAIEKIGNYDGATFYFYTKESKAGYCFYINRMGCGIKKDDKIFKITHRYLYNKRHLSNCFFGEKDCRFGEYFGK